MASGSVSIAVLLGVVVLPADSLMSLNIPSKTSFSVRVMLLGLLFLLVASATAFAFCDRKDSECSSARLLGATDRHLREGCLGLTLRTVEFHEDCRRMVRVWYRNGSSTVFMMSSRRAFEYRLSSPGTSMLSLQLQRKNAFSLTVA